MFKYAKRFFSLPWAKQWLFIEALSLTGIIRLAIILLPFRWLSPYLGEQMRESSMQENALKVEEARIIGSVVETVSRFTPWESKCLVQAMTGKFMLRRRRISNTLYLGVRKDESKGMLAHAWLRCGQNVVNGGYGRDKFTVVGQFVDDGGLR